jgi:hypothetical protein
MMVWNASCTHKGVLRHTKHQWHCQAYRHICSNSNWWDVYVGPEFLYSRDLHEHLWGQHLARSCRSPQLMEGPCPTW